MGEEGLQTLGMLSAGRNTAAGLRTDDHGEIRLAADHPRQLGRLVQYFIHTNSHKVHKIMDNNGAEAHRRRADSKSGNGGFTQGRVNNAHGAVFGEKALRLPKGGPVDAHVLTADKNAGVSRHLNVLRLANRLGKRQHSTHAASLPPS